MRKLLLILGVSLLGVMSVRAQTWSWVGDGSANTVTTSTNWSPSGTLALTGSTELVFGDSGSYSPSPFLGAGNYQIGTLTLTRTTGGSIFAGNGDGTFSGGFINGLNIGTAINFNTSATGIQTSTTGPIYLGSGITIGGSAASSDILSLGSPKGGGSNGIVSSAGAVTKSGSFQLLLSGDASGLGQINLTGGSVFLSSTATGFQSNVVTSAGTTFGIHPNTNANYTYSGAISGSGGFTMNGNNSGSTTVLTGSNSYSGQTRVMTGVLSLGADNTLPSSAFVNLSSNATLNIGGNQTINNFVSGTGSGSFVTLAAGKTLTVKPVTTGFTQTSYSGTISGSGALVIDGTGGPLSGGSKVKLDGNNTWGSATVAAGSLELIGANTGGVTVNGGALIGDRGSITGALTVNSGGTFGVVTNFTSGATTFNGGSTLLWGLADAALAAGTGYGTLAVNGGLTLSSGSPVTLQIVSFSTGGSNPGPGAAANFDTTHNYSFTLATTTGGITGFNASVFTLDFTNFQNAYSGTWSTSLDGNNLLLNYTGGSAIPEPATVALGCGAFALGAAALRRRRLRVMARS